MERIAIDFKTTGSPTDTQECAKDVAAFANAAGGTILIGARAEAALLKEYVLIPEDVAGKLADAYDQAAADLCSPSPRLTTEMLRPDEESPGVLLAVNVWPSPAAPVGVRQTRRGQQGADWWSFPVRVGTHTNYLQPAQLATLEGMSARRAASLLIGIPQGEKNIHFHFIQRDRDLRPAGLKVGRLERVDPTENAAQFMLGNHPSDALYPVVVPLDWVQTVWREPNGPWHVLTSASYMEEHGRLVQIRASDA